MTQCCTHGEAISMGQYWLNSNLWGAQTGEGSQCLWDTSLDGASIAWGTSWDWTGAAEAVKSYNCAVLGWHWGWKHAHTGLPLRLDTLPRILTSWRFTLAQSRPGGLNVSYDLWLSPDPQLGNANASEEVMIWLSRSGDIRPIGAKQATLNLAGSTWEFWEGSLPANGWPVHSFVRTTNTTVQALKLTEFLDVLLARGVSKTSYLLSVEAGVEVFTGAGRVDTTAYSVEIGEASPTL